MKLTAAASAPLELMAIGVVKDAARRFQIVGRNPYMQASGSGAGREASSAPTTQPRLKTETLKEAAMKQRLLALAAVFIVFVASVSLPAQTTHTSRPINEKLYISLENTDELAVVDLKSFTAGENPEGRYAPHGQASPASQDNCSSPRESAGRSRSWIRFATRWSGRSTSASA